MLPFLGVGGPREMRPARLEGGGVVACAHLSPYCSVRDCYILLVVGLYIAQMMGVGGYLVKCLF
jgi:hypothetical protein